MVRSNLFLVAGASKEAGAEMLGRAMMLSNQKSDQGSIYGRVCNTPDLQLKIRQAIPRETLEKVYSKE